MIHVNRVIDNKMTTQSLINKVLESLIHSATAFGFQALLNDSYAEDSGAFIGTTDTII